MDKHTEYRHKARRYNMLLCAKAVRVIGVVVPILGVVYAVAVIGISIPGLPLAVLAHATHALFGVVVFGVACFAASSVTDTLGDIMENVRPDAHRPGQSRQ